MAARLNVYKEDDEEKTSRQNKGLQYLWDYQKNRPKWPLVLLITVLGLLMLCGLIGGLYYFSIQPVTPFSIQEPPRPQVVQRKLAEVPAEIDVVEPKVAEIDVVAEPKVAPPVKPRAQRPVPRFTPRVPRSTWRPLTPEDWDSPQALQLQLYPKTEAEEIAYYLSDQGKAFMQERQALIDKYD